MPEKQEQELVEEASLPQAEIAVIVMGDKGDVLLGKIPEGFDKDKVSMPMSRIEPFESLSDAAKRTVMEWAGVEVNPQHAIFVCESIHPEVQEHRVVIFVFANRIGKASNKKDSFWVDVRELGNYQEDLSDLAADGFYKLSIILKRQAQAADSQPKQA
jgi:ADP-ribose pyrophosphatase YjhB (NUDIX family)